MNYTKSMETINTTNPVKSTQVYWCNVCDDNQVHSDKPETGKFYQVFGHEFHTGDYTSVFFAVCSTCDVMKSLKVK